MAVSLDWTARLAVGDRAVLVVVPNLARRGAVRIWGTDWQGNSARQAMPTGAAGAFVARLHVVKHTLHGLAMNHLACPLQGNVIGASYS